MFVVDFSSRHDVTLVTGLGSCSADEAKRSQCCSVDWQVQDDCRRLIAGFNDGRQRKMYFSMKKTGLAILVHEPPLGMVVICKTVAVASALW